MASAADRERFRAFLHEHRYAPQGKLARAGGLEDRDLDALLRPGVAPVWRWVCQNMRGAEQLDLVRRNVRLAQRRIASSQRERQEAARDVERLEARRTQALEALRKAGERERALLASLRAVEEERRGRGNAAMDDKQRRALQRAFRAQTEAEDIQVVEKVRQVRQMATMPDAPLQAVEAAGDTRENPLDVLLREYMRLLNASEAAERVEFGDRDIEHVRQFGGHALLRWLQETASRPVNSRTSHKNAQDVQYATHVEERTLSSREALGQVRAHLRRYQKQHIARFADTQAAYARAEQLNQEVAEWESSQAAMATDELVEEAVELEMANAVERAALTAAVDTYGEVVSQVEAARKHKLELEQQLEMVDSFDRRQQNVLDHMRAMYAENQSRMAAVAARQQELQAFAREHILESYGGGKSGRLLQQRQVATTEELRQLAGMRQRLGDVFDVALFESVAIAGSGDGRDNGVAIQRDLLVPFAQFSINQLARDNCGDRGNNPLDRVFSALGVPPYGSWEALLERLDELEKQCSVDQVETTTSSEMRALVRELEDEERGEAPHSKTRVAALVDEMRGVSDTMERASLPLLEEAMRATRETSDRLVPRLQELTRDLVSQRGWSVGL